MMRQLKFSIVMLFVFFASLFFVGKSGGETSLIRSTASGFAVDRGTNISHWLSQSQRRGPERAAFFTRQDVEFLADLGFDHLRIPVDEEQLWDESGEPIEEAFGLLESALDWCAEFRLRTIVDLHILRSHHFNRGDKPLWTDPSAQERFLDCWADLSDRLSDRPDDQVAYELMNEPVADDPEEWNQLVERAVRFLREREPNRPLVIGSNRWQSASTFDQLRVPEDQNIVLSFHFYTPMPLTHYRASWTKVGEYRGPVQYPGKVVPDNAFAELPADLKNVIGQDRYYDRQVLLEKIQKPIALARKLGLPLYCGEWGCLPSTPREDRLQWYSDVRLNLETNGIGWATWDYKGGFGIVDGEGQKDQELINTLLGPQRPPVMGSQRR